MDRGKGRRGRRQPAGWSFEYAGMRCVIPAVYRFPGGIVFDILSFADEAELAEYISRCESAEERLDSSERRCVEQETPIRMCFSQPSFTESATYSFYIEGLSATRIGETVITLGNEQRA